jgi:hypothetical protein
LVENALSFSPPDSDVEIEGRRTSAGYLVAIVDHGFGMDNQALAEANVRLSGTASFMAEPTRFLGHFVVGALARKCGIEVRLGEAPAAGVVARVLIPAGLLTEKAVEAAPAVPAPRKAETEEMKSEEPEAQVAPVAAKGGSSAARTRNGLVKRPQRSGIAAAVSETDRTGRPAPATPPNPERTPEQVSGMLSTLRSAHMRGGISVEKEKRQNSVAKNAETNEGAAK